MSMTRRDHCRWSREEEERLRMLWPEYSLHSIACRMGRTMRAISVRAFQLELGNPDENTQTMRAFLRATGYSIARVFAAAIRLGIEFRRSRRQDPRQRSQTVRWAITDEQGEKILRFLAGVPDGKRLYTNRALRSDRGVWDVGIKPPCCRECGTTARPHRAKGRCASCYVRRFRERGST